LNFKFWVGATKTKPLRNYGSFENNPYSEEGWEGGPNRQLTIPASQTADTVLPEIWIGNTGVNPPAPPGPDSINVFFNVAAYNLYVVNRISENDTLFVTGYYRSKGERVVFEKPLQLGWTGTAEFGQKSNSAAFFYANNVAFPANTIDTLFYRFRADSLEFESKLPSFYRRLVVPERDTALQWVVFENEPLTTGLRQVVHKETIQIDMLPLEKSGLFDSKKGDRLVVRGDAPFARDARLDDRYAMVWNDENQVYNVPVEVTAGIGSLVRYTLGIAYDTARFQPHHADHIPELAITNNRFFIENLKEEQSRSMVISGSGSSQFWLFDNIRPILFSGPKPVIKNNAQEISVGFNVDVSEALSSASNPFPVMQADDSVFVVFEHGLSSLMLTRSIRRRINGKPALALLRSDTNASFFTGSLSLRPPFIAQFSFRLAYGKSASAGLTFNGLDSSDTYVTHLVPSSITLLSAEDPKRTLANVEWNGQNMLASVSWKPSELPDFYTDFYPDPPPPPDPLPPDYWWCPVFQGELWPSWMFETVSTEKADVPSQLALSSHPNPFNPVADVHFQVPESGRVLLQLFSIDGRRVAVLHNGILPAGKHTMAVTGNNLASGVYMLVLQAQGHTAARKITLLK
jgi:hypothetical protein